MNRSCTLSLTLSIHHPCNLGVLCVSVLKTESQRILRTLTSLLNDPTAVLCRWAKKLGNCFETKRQNNVALGMSMDHLHVALHRVAWLWAHAVCEEDVERFDEDV